MSEKDLEEIRDSIAAMRDSIEDEELFLSENRRFHHLVAWSSGNPLLGYLINSLHWITDGTALGTTYPTDLRHVVLRAHERILEAMETGDGAASFEAMKSHMDNTVYYFEEQFPQLLSRRLTWDDFTD